MTTFPIVGIGASAGGIQAIGNLLEHLRPDLGMAFILVMHLSPNHKSALAEIMRSKTNMPVQTVKNGMKVVPNNLYVIPPGTFMTIADGHLKLAPRAVTTIGNFAVDYLFTALASAYRNKAIGIILSGTATDGTLGLKAIKAEGGITFAQDDTAEFPGMPDHAYQAGYVDFLLSPEGIAQELAHLITVPYTILPSDDIESESTPPTHHASDMKKILAIVKSKTGVDFYNHYKQASIYRRVMRRMVLMKSDQLHDYYSILLTNPKEVDALYDDFLINVTSFFRDPEFFTALSGEVFPSIIKRLNDFEPFRIWVAGCATGEEAYSIAICLLEFLDAKNFTTPIQIFASDLDANAIEKARMGIYPVSALHGITESRLKRYFTKSDGNYQVNKSVREICVFSQQNLLKDPPFSRMHLISCQNVLIYLETAPQHKILQTFHYALRPSGFLFLGKSESISTQDDLFETRGRKVKLFTRKTTTPPQMGFTVDKTRTAIVKGSQPERIIETDPERVISKLVLAHFVLPSLVVNKNLMITQFFGSTSQYLQPVTGKASFNILKMIREELVIDLGNLLQQARKTETTASIERIRIYNDNQPKDISIDVVPKKTSEEILYLVVFRESPIVIVQAKHPRSKGTADQKDKKIEKLEQELVYSRSLIRNTNEEYATTYEELQANNEEILSSNEELQSVNEELESSKEELQSAVEELTTTNDELRKRNVDLSDSQDELKKVNAQLEQFAFISSHDLQEPLRKILTFSNLLSNPEANLNEFSKSYSTKISASANRLSSLLKDLLSFSVLINKENRFETVKLNEVVENVLTGLDADIQKVNAVVHVSELPAIIAEPIQMDQLFRCLLSNSLKFGKKNPYISITSEVVLDNKSSICQELLPNRKYVSIQVKDNGIGFEEKYTEKIFSLFQRLNDKEGVEGTGIGLAICKKVVQNHGGFIVAKGKKGAGATFTVFLPTDNKVHDD